MAYQATPAPHQMRYGYSVVFTVHQDRILRLVMLGHEVSFSELVEAALHQYISSYYGKRFPLGKRFHRVTKRIGKRVMVNGRFPYGVMFNQDQDRVLRELIHEYRVPFSHLVESALAMYVPSTFGEDWPPGDREHRTA